MIEAAIVLAVLVALLLLGYIAGFLSEMVEQNKVALATQHELLDIRRKESAVYLAEHAPETVKARREEAIRSAADGAFLRFVAGNLAGCMEPEEAINRAADTFNLAMQVFGQKHRVERAKEPTP